jgi:hypothetical protein
MTWPTVFRLGPLLCLSDRLELDLTYPRDPRTLSQYIRKFREDKGFLIKDLTGELGALSDTAINWEVIFLADYQLQTHPLNYLKSIINRQQTTSLE